MNRLEAFELAIQTLRQGQQQPALCSASLSSAMVKLFESCGATQERLRARDPNVALFTSALAHSALDVLVHLLLQDSVRREAAAHLTKDATAGEGILHLIHGGKP